MDDVTDHRDVLNAFGLELSSSSAPGPLFSFSAVFLVRHESRDVILKRTRTPIDRAHALLRWTTHLRSQGISVVTPVPGLEPNPVEVGQDVWVAYPFIDGEVYRGTQAQVRAAGELLGAIHSVEWDDSSFAGFAWPDEDEASIVTDVSALAGVLRAARVSGADDLITAYADRLRVAHTEFVSALRSADLEWRCGPWDYKANNLVYVADGSPTLVDPDSAGHLPRVLDLALAAVLFHNEAPSAPGRLFTAAEWSWFYSGYRSKTDLSTVEKELWPIALEFMHLDEGLWLLLNDPEGWEKQPQRDFLLDLLTSDLDQLGRLR